MVYGVYNQDNSKTNSFICIYSCDSAYLLDGIQLISKYNEEAKNTVQVHIAILRFKEYLSDILIIFNDPLAIK